MCNISKSLHCSPPKHNKKENCVQTAPLSSWGRRLVFDENLLGKELASPVRNELEAKAPCPLLKGQETPSSCDRSFRKGGKTVCARLFKQEGTWYQQVKQALNTAVPDQLLVREKETDSIRKFLRQHVCGGKPGSLYISGAPGTGKTVCLRKILQDSKEELRAYRTIFINCMSLSSPQGIFPCIAEGMAEAGKTTVVGKDIVKKLEKQVTTEGPMVLLVLDEMDQLDSRGHDVLYTVFEWPCLMNSRLVLIGIANALDLTDRILPRLQARPKCKPQLLNFSPYTKDEIATILQGRLKEVSGDQVLDNAAIQFCARKVSAMSGDARKALDVCRRAVEIVESDVRSQTVLKPLSECTSPTKASSAHLVPKKVGLPHISRVMLGVYGDRMTSDGGVTEHSFPLQQKLLVCTLLLLIRQSKVKEVSLGKLHEMYSKVCRKQQMAAVDQSECLSLSNLLEARGILALKKAKESRLIKISLNIEEKDVEHSLKDKVLIGNILAGGLP
ncbi:cell division control protein 6 homolog isoform X2 [Rhinatrema bivittatum]|nr:cell division control protein 6 homolog isoform X2 [Rhinatrema bivittatum]XP_029429576.1 cell division control protein 6 homolog isoform X2 [Rhinatrema bivittatum]XP_029429577.1 cell division control protein 6 homolog isoform X2 [Rhinatrema bivittatum]